MIIKGGSGGPVVGGGRKRGGKRKIPILSQDRMPIYTNKASASSEERDEEAREKKLDRPVQSLNPDSNDSVDDEHSPSDSTLSKTSILTERLLPLMMMMKKKIAGSQSQPLSPAPMVSTEDNIASPVAEDDYDDDGCSEDVSSLLSGNSCDDGDCSSSKGTESIRRRMEVAKERMRLALPLLTEAQRIRYDTFRRSAISRPTMKRWMQSFMGQPVNANMAIIGAGISKVFVGELIEMASEVCASWGDALGGAPLLPSHIREAYRRMLAGPGCSDPYSFVPAFKKRRLL